MSITPTSASAAPNSSGCWVMVAPTSSPPFERPLIAMRSGRGPAGRRQPPEARGEVVEDVLLVREATGVVPRLAVLPSPTERRDGEQPAALHPGEPLGLEGRPDGDVEAAVAVEERGDVAGRLDVATAGEEQRDASAVVRRHEDLLADEVGRVPGERRPPDLADGAVGHPHGEDDRRRDEASRRSGTARRRVGDRTSRRSSRSRAGARPRRDGRRARTTPAGCGRRGGTPPPADRRRDGRARARRPSRRSTSRALVRIVDVHGDHAAEWRVAVGLEVDRAIDRRDVVVPRIGRVEDRPHTRGLDAVGEIGDVDPALRVRSPPDRDDEKAAVVGDRRLEAPLRLGRDREDQRVVRADPFRAGDSAAPCRRFGASYAASAGGSG